MVAVSDIATADAAPGLTRPVSFGGTAGVPATQMPLAGVAANLAFGPVLRLGETVSLDLDGQAIKRWRVTRALADGPRPGGWTIDAPARGARDDLTVTMGAPIDALDLGLIAVVGSDGQAVAGSATRAAGERVWRFAPALPGAPVRTGWP